DLPFLVPAIRPEREAFFLVTRDDDQADQVIEPLVRVALHIEVDADRAGRQRRRPEHIDPFVPHGEGLQGGRVTVGAGWRPLALAPGSEGVGQLRDGEDALAGVRLDLLLLHAPQEADVVLLGCLLLAPLAELADGAVVVEQQPGGRPLPLQQPEFVEDSPGLAGVRAQAHPSGPTLLAMPEEAEAWHPSLETREQQPVDLQQGPLFLANLPS